MIDRRALLPSSCLPRWMLWKHQNACIFHGDHANAAMLLAQIKEEAIIWSRAGVLGLRVYLPTSWDFH